MSKPPTFYINRNRYIELSSHMSVGFEGYFYGRALKDGRVVREFGASKNLITNLGLDAIGTGPLFARMHLGTGTSAPLVTDTALTNFGVNVASANPSSTSGIEAGPPTYGWNRMTWTSDVGAATGVWTEIGISSQNTNGNLRSHALIVDGGGSPTSFPVLADEQFQGTYEFRVYPSIVDVPASVNLSGTPYDTITRALNIAAATGNGTWAPPVNGTTSGSQPMYTVVTSGFPGPGMYSGDLASVTDVFPLGSALSLGTFTGGNLAYGSGNYYRDGWVRWGSGGSAGNGRTLCLRFRGGSLQVQYDPTIPKLPTEELILNQRVLWARI